jgi:hypothetical protein
MTSTLSKVHCNNELNCPGLLTTQIHKIHNLHVNNNKQEVKVFQNRLTILQLTKNIFIFTISLPRLGGYDI